MKRITYLLSILLLLFGTMTICAQEPSSTVVMLQINNPNMSLNGKLTTIDSENTAPQIIEDRTLVPIRAIIEAFDGSVEWDSDAKSVLLNKDNDNIRLTIDNNIAYFNNSPQNLDVAPVIINGRTMLPIRFIADCFNLGVAWNGDTKTIWIIEDTFTDDEYNRLTSALPSYSGNSYVYVNNNKPYFNDYEIIDGEFEYYSDLDELGRCDVCFSGVSKGLMPTGERGDISSVKPTGWVNVTYDFVPGKYLYNRCHLIGYQLTGENANPRNLITGTRYLNIEGMLPFENMVNDYIDATGNKVLYRSTPVFTGNNLLADGVLLEAYSVEDNGQGLSFCVYCYNVQPMVIIDYRSGVSSSSAQPEADNSGNKIYRTPYGKRYHYDAQCGGKNSYEITLDMALKAGLTPCSKCVK